MRPVLEVADIFRDYGAAWRRTNAGHVSLGQLKVMSAIEQCRTAALGGHVARCENEACRHTVIAFNSCRDRHCPKCQGGAARKWLAEREAELLDVGYFHLVFTLPAPVADITFSWPRLTWPALARRQAPPWSRKMSATSSSGRTIAASVYAGSFCLRRFLGANSWPIGLATAAMMPVATRV